MQDLLDLTHLLTRLKLAPTAAAGDPIAEGDRARAAPLAEKAAMPALARAWQMLLKGLGEVREAPSPIQAAEMVLVRLAFVADLPAPAELVRALAGEATPRDDAVAEPPPIEPARRAGVPTGPAARSTTAAVPAAIERVEAALETLPAAPPPPSGSAPSPMPQSFLEVVALCDERREAVLSSQLQTHVHLVHFEPGRIEFRLAPGAPRDLANRLGSLLGAWTGARWLIAVSEAAGEPTLRERRLERETELRNGVAGHPLVRAVLETFPGATIAAVRRRFAAAEDGETADGAATDGDEVGIAGDEEEEDLS